MSRSILFAAALIASAANGAQAQSVYNVLSSHHLLGTWSAACAQPVGGDNPRLTLSAPQRGRGSLVLDHGQDDVRTAFVIMMARDLTADRFLIHRYSVDDNSLTDLILRKADGRLRILDERVTDTNESLIHDTVIVGTERKTEWLERCPEPR